MSGTVLGVAPRCIGSVLPIRQQKAADLPNRSRYARAEERFFTFAFCTLPFALLLLHGRVVLPAAERYRVYNAAAEGPFRLYSSDR